jgi:2-polyprenyl-3-methyl-5-hydroxy-6-metoxy-1,4-benzoquinol methylase
MLKKIISTEIIKCEICKTTNYKKICTTKDFSYETCNNKFIINKCETCNILYLKNRPTFKSYKQIYPNNYTAFKLIDKINFFHLFAGAGNFLKVLQIKFNINQKSKILEIGPGSGQLLKQLIRFTKAKKKNIFFLENNKISYNNLKKKGFKSYFGVYEKLKIKNKFDIIIMNQVFEHFKNPKKIIKKLNSNLKKNGLIYLETPSFDFLYKKNKNFKFWGGLHAPRHMYIYNMSSIKKVFEEKFFSVIKIQPIISPYLLYETFKAKLKNGKNNALLIFLNLKNPIIIILLIIFEYINILLLEKYSNMKVVVKKI